MPKRMFDELKSPPRIQFPAAMGFCCGESGITHLDGCIRDVAQKSIPGAWCHGLTDWQISLVPQAGLTPELMRSSLDYHVVRGIEVSDAEDDIEVIPGAWNDNPLDPWRSAYREYATRLSWLLTQGTHIAHLGILDPAAVAAVQDVALEEMTLGESTPGQAAVIGRFLLQHQTSYRVLDDSLLSEAEVGKGKIQLRGESLRAILLPPDVAVAEATLKTLAAFVEFGGLLIVMGSSQGVSPEHTDEADAKKLFDHDAIPGNPAMKPVGDGRVVRIREGVSPLARMIEEYRLSDTQLQSPCPELKALHRRGEYWDLFFLVNESDRSQRVAGALNSLDPPVWIDLEKGTERRALGFRDHCDGGTDFDLVFAPHESKVICFYHHEGRLPEQTEEQVAWEHAVTLEDWAFGGGGIERMTRPRSWTELGLPFYSGEGLYRSEFDAEESAARILLDLGDVHDVATVSVNGKEVGTRPWRPYHFEITGLVVPGTNTVDVKVVNSAANKVLEEERPAGLLGPVRLFTAE